VAKSQVPPGQPEAPLLSVIIPVSNERANLQPLLDEIEAVFPAIPGACEVIVVDDGSRDGSWEVLTELAARRPWLRCLRFLGRQGQTAAIAAGIADARGNLLAFLDGDLQNDPADLPRMVEQLRAGDVDVVCGWRVHRRDRPLTRTIPSRIANAILTRALRLHLHDLGCALKVFRRPFIEDAELYGEMHRFLPAYALAQGARIAEIPVNHRPRTQGSSHYGLGRTYRVLIDLLTVKLLNSYATKPAYFFGKIAIAFFLLGTAMFGVVAYRALALDRTQSTPMIFIMLLMYITSVICLMSGLLAELSIRILHRTGGRRPFRIIARIGEERSGSDPS
jgi:glycosyltransferase involved in cell wall biosynthesis